MSPYTIPEKKDNSLIKILVAIVIVLVLVAIGIICYNKTLSPSDSGLKVSYEVEYEE